jgi:hypothetical protein
MVVVRKRTNYMLFCNNQTILSYRKYSEDILLATQQFGTLRILTSKKRGYEDVGSIFSVSSRQFAPWTHLPSNNKNNRWELGKCVDEQISDLLSCQEHGIKVRVSPINAFECIPNIYSSMHISAIDTQGYWKRKEAEEDIALPDQVVQVMEANPAAGQEYLVEYLVLYRKSSVSAFCGRRWDSFVSLGCSSPFCFRWLWCQ